MNDFDTPSILAVGARLANLSRAKAAKAVDHASVAEADSGKKAFELMRVLRFDLVVISPDVCDMTPFQLASRLKTAKPWQRWVLVADEQLTNEQEVMARSLGAIAVLEGPDAWREVIEMAHAARKRHPETTVPGLAYSAAG